MGSRERVKFAEANRVDAESGGRPWLGVVVLVGNGYGRYLGCYRTRSANVKG